MPFMPQARTHDLIHGENCQHTIFMHIELSQQRSFLYVSDIMSLLEFLICFEFRYSNFGFIKSKAPSLV